MDPETSLPSSRTFITSLINSISATQTQTNTPPTKPSNPLKSAPPSIRPLLLTLHVLFPQEFLPALDILDRNLITRLRLKHAAEVDDPPPPAHQQPTVYIVRSAQAQPQSHYRHHSSSRFTNALANSAMHYEVRTTAWNCSCPAFAFSAFPAQPARGGQLQMEREDSGEWSFGGLGLGTPVCKHLLACVLVERCPGVFGLAEGGVMEEREVDAEEMAGWCAGWGG